MSGPLRIALAVLAGLLACGLPLWPLAYSEVEFLEKPNPGVWLMLGAGAGVLAGYLIRPNWLVPGLSVALGYVLAVYGRVHLETAKDPTSHNLWPFEIVIAGGFGLFAGFVGVAIARALQRLAGGPK